MEILLLLGPTLKNCTTAKPDTLVRNLGVNLPLVNHSYPQTEIHVELQHTFPKAALVM